MYFSAIKIWAYLSASWKKLIAKLSTRSTVKEVFVCTEKEQPVQKSSAMSSLDLGNLQQTKFTRCATKQICQLPAPN